MRGDAIDHERMLTISRRHLDAELHVSAFVLVSENFSHVVKQRTTTRHRDIQSELGSHYSREPRNFLRVIQDILAVAGSPAHAADQLDHFGMETVDSARIRRALTCINDT